MTDPTLDRATTALTDLAAHVGKLTHEVKQSETLRTRKIRVIQNVLYVLVPAIVLLLVLAISNFVLLSRVKAAAQDARDTNELLVSCFQPNTYCSNASAQRTGDALNQLRQTQFVIAICQRRNTLADDPTGAKVVACVQEFYPNFTLPPRAK